MRQPFPESLRLTVKTTSLFVVSCCGFATEMLTFLSSGVFEINTTDGLSTEMLHPVDVTLTVPDFQNTICVTFDPA